MVPRSGRSSGTGLHCGDPRRSGYAFHTRSFCSISFSYLISFKANLFVDHFTYLLIRERGRTLDDGHLVNFRPPEYLPNLTGDLIHRPKGPIA